MILFFYFLGIVLAQLVLKAIECLENLNCIIDRLICDGVSTNRKMWKDFSISGVIKSMKNYLTHPLDENRKVFEFSDILQIYFKIYILKVLETDCTIKKFFG